jgi:AcrR family transcriptional regulator
MKKRSTATDRAVPDKAGPSHGTKNAEQARGQSVRSRARAKAPRAATKPVRQRASEPASPGARAKTRGSSSRPAQRGAARPGGPPSELARRLPPEARRAQIIAVAEGLFNTHPYGELGVPEVARALRITAGLVYHYFPTKEALLVAAVEARARELLEACLPDPALPVLVQIERGVRGYFDYCEAHSLAYRNLLRGPTASEPEVVRICESARVAIVEHFVQAVGVASRAMPATRLALRAYLGFAEHALVLWLERRQVARATLENMCRSMMIAALRAGLSSDTGSPATARQLALLEDAQQHFIPS